MKLKYQPFLKNALKKIARNLCFLPLPFLIGAVSCSPNEALDDNLELQTTLSTEAKKQMPISSKVLTDELLVPTGSTIGPGGDLFVTESVTGSIWRINTKTGEKSLYASDLPKMNPLIGLGGVMDVVFIGDTGYALTTLVDPIFGNADAVSGIYKINPDGSHEILANLGAFSMENLPSGFFIAVPTGVQYSIEVYQGGFLVADGHHNRILHVTKDGVISEFKAFGNIVPTGLEVSGNTVYMAEAGPSPHMPEDGRVVSFNSSTSEVSEVAAGARLLVDVEINRGRTMFALSQGVWEGDPDTEAGKPALPNTGSLVKVNADGSFSTVLEGLNLPSSMEFKGNSAYIITLAGEVIEVDNVDGPPFGN